MFLWDKFKSYQALSSKKLISQNIFLAKIYSYVIVFGQFLHLSVTVQVFYHLQL